MKKHTSVIFLLLFTVSLIFNQTTALFKQQDEIKTMIKEQVYSIIELGTELKNNQFGVWVDVTLENNKPLPLKSIDAPEVINEDIEDDFYDMLTGTRPGVPNPKSPSKSINVSNNSNGYYIADLSIRIYLDQNIEGLNSLQTNIKSLVEQQLSGILCEDCIEFQLKDFNIKAIAEDIGLQDQLDKIKTEMAARELTIIKDKLTSKDSILAVYADQINEHMTHLHQQDSIKQAAEQERMVRLEENEKKYRSKQDSLYVLTSIKLDEAVRGRIQSEETTKKELLNVIKMQIQGDSSKLDISEYSEDTQSDLLGKRPIMAKKGISMQMWLMIIALVLLMIILLIIIMKNKQPIYLKPTESSINNTSSPAVDNSEAATYTPTTANQNEEVLKSEMQSLRQTAVSMSVSEKTGANQIVQDWLDDSGAEETKDNGDDNETENKE